MQILSTEKKNAVLQRMEELLKENEAAIRDANAKDQEAFQGKDPAMYDRLLIKEGKVADMIRSVKDIREEADPIGVQRYDWTHPNGMKVKNLTAPFGTILIIYESRPDVTIEAASVAFKSNNKILLKGGKEARHSNLALVDCWHQALVENGLGVEWITYLDLPREQTQDFLRHPTEPVDLIVPRGGDGLINFVKEHASCPVLVSGRGNNFVYVHDDADWEKALKIIFHSKVDKVSACNALDKVLINASLPGLREKSQELISKLQSAGISVRIFAQDQGLEENVGTQTTSEESEWYEEYLDKKILISTVPNMSEAIAMINKYSGGHSSAILTEDEAVAQDFMLQVDAAAVYHNASTRFTDGGQMGMGAELAISTDKLHHRGPLGLQQLVTNKWYVFGQGQVRG